MERYKKHLSVSDNTGPLALPFSELTFFPRKHQLDISAQNESFFPGVIPDSPDDLSAIKDSFQIYEMIADDAM